MQLRILIKAVKVVMSVIRVLNEEEKDPMKFNTPILHIHQTQLRVIITIGCTIENRKKFSNLEVYFKNLCPDPG
jgi:hypothetical protein